MAEWDARGVEPTVGLIERPVVSWTDYLSFVEDTSRYGIAEHLWYFRGQAKSDWSLQTSLHRELRDLHLANRDALDVEFRLFSFFRSEAHYLIDPAHTKDGEKPWQQWWFLMQHHGCPTRLLDWTLSPMVALYFAVNKEDGEDGALWAFDVTAVETAFEGKRPELKSEAGDSAFTNGTTLPFLYCIQPLFHTDRSSAQQSRFTVCTNVLVDHEVPIGHTLSSADVTGGFFKLIIPSRLKPEFLDRLHGVNITPGALFPGVDGIGRSTSELLRRMVRRAQPGPR